MGRIILKMTRLVKRRLELPADATVIESDSDEEFSMTLIHLCIRMCTTNVEACHFLDLFSLQLVISLFSVVYFFIFYFLFFHVRLFLRRSEKADAMIRFLRYPIVCCSFLLIFLFSNMTLFIFLPLSLQVHNLLTEKRKETKQRNCKTQANHIHNNHYRYKVYTFSLLTFELKEREEREREHRKTISLASSCTQQQQVRHGSHLSLTFVFFSGEDDHAAALAARLQPHGPERGAPEALLKMGRLSCYV